MGGGGPKQVNSGQASAADTAATNATNQSTALSQQYGNQEQQQYNKLFGTNGQGGTLSGMMNPASLNTGTPTGAYKTAWNSAQNQIGKNYANERGTLAQSFANSGANSRSTPTGFGADQMNQLARGEADTRGSTYTGIVGQQHQDALNNFWNANNIAAGQSANATTGSVNASGNAGSTAANLYGTAGKQAQTGTSPATGITEATLCPASGSKILMFDKSLKNVEDLVKGDQVMGIDGSADEVLDSPEPSKPTDAVFVQTREFAVFVSQMHTFVRPEGGYMFAGKSVGKPVLTMAGIQNIISTALHGEKVVCWRVFLSRSHTYCANGIWSLE